MTAQRCSQRARADGVLPSGTAGVGDRFEFIQMEPPWPARMEDASLRLAEIPHDPSIVVRAIWPVVPAPSPRGTSLTFSRPHAPCEHLDGSEAGGAIEPGVRDIVVCTHGTRDQCCGSTGMRLVNELAAWAIQQPDVRLWRTSHLGGHRFAPTLVDLPSGDSWAFMDPSVALELLTRDPTPAFVRRHHRGWWGLSSPFEQAAETEAWAVIGTPWRTGARAGHTVETSHGGDLVQVRLGSTHPDGRVTTVRAEVRRTLRSQMVSCGETRDEAEYTVTQLEVEAP